MPSEPLGLEAGAVVVVPYDPRWPALYEAEVERLTKILNPLRVRFEHTGSTAVPGLAAKPVLDILAGYDAPVTLESLIDAFERAGYQHRGPQGIPEREFFRRGDPRAYHIHLTKVGSSFWKDHLIFRDRLRSDPHLCAAYAALKLELAARFPHDRESYIEGKSAFIRAAIGAS